MKLHYDKEINVNEREITKEKDNLDIECSHRMIYYQFTEN